MKQILVYCAAALVLMGCCKTQEQPKGITETLLLNDFRPVSVNNIPQTFVEKAKYPVIDMHSHDYIASAEDVDAWVEAMDACGITETHIMHCSWIGKPFEEVMAPYAKYGDRFKFWCSLDYTQLLKDGSADEAIAYLEKCKEMGAVGVGEMGDKGQGDLYARPTEGYGLHIDDARLKPVWAKCAELKMPVNIHVGEPYWMYLPQDASNDGLPNGAVWYVDTTAADCLGYEGLMETFENALRENPKTIFIACHYLNMNQDLPRLGAMLDKYPNMYIDISARVAESAHTPRATRAFLIKYQDRVLFGTDNGMAADMYRNIFRILETEDEHIYIHDFNYHWPLSAFYLPDTVLEKIYNKNAKRILTEYK